MKRILFGLCFIIIALISLSGCSFEIRSVDSLIRSPKLTGENAAIQSAFEAAVGKDVVLVSPSAGSYRSSYVMVDYDNDSVEETIVFYSKKTDELTVRLNILDNSDGVWSSVADVSTGGSDIYEMRLDSIDGDKIPEILITWSVMDTNRYKYLTVFKTSAIESKNIAAIATIMLDEYRVFDINVDGVNEIFYTYFDSSTDEYLPFAAVQRYDNQSQSFLQIGEAAINPLAVSFVSYSFDLKEGVNRIYIDCLRSDGLGFTELLCWDPENALLLTPLSEIGNSASLTSRLSNETCKDIEIAGESDGLIEIPFEESPQGSESVGDESGIVGSVIVRTWFAYTDGELIPVKKCYINSEDGYELILDKELGELDIVHYQTSGVTEFYRNAEGKRSELLFTVTVVADKTEGDTLSVLDNSASKKELFVVTTPFAEENNIDENIVTSHVVML